MWETKKNMRKYLEKEGYFTAFYYIMQVMRTNGEKSNDYSHQQITIDWGIKVLDNIERFVINKYNLIDVEVYKVTRPYTDMFWREHNNTIKAMKKRLEVYNI